MKTIPEYTYQLLPPSRDVKETLDFLTRRRKKRYLGPQNSFGQTRRPTEGSSRRFT